MPSEIYLEIVPLDNGLRVTAVDAQTGTEVVFAAPKNCSRDRMNELAFAKLKRRLALDAGQNPKAGRQASSSHNQRQRGRLV